MAMHTVLHTLDTSQVQASQTNPKQMKANQIKSSRNHKLISQEDSDHAFMMQVSVHAYVFIRKLKKTQTTNHNMNMNE